MRAIICWILLAMLSVPAVSLGAATRVDEKWNMHATDAPYKTPSAFPSHVFADEIFGISLEYLIFAHASEKIISVDPGDILHTGEEIEDVVFQIEIGNPHQRKIELKVTYVSGDKSHRPIKRKTIELDSLKNGIFHLSIKPYNGIPLKYRNGVRIQVMVDEWPIFDFGSFICIKDGELGS